MCAAAPSVHAAGSASGQCAGARDDVASDAPLQRDDVEGGGDVGEERVKVSKPFRVEVRDPGVHAARAREAHSEERLECRPLGKDGHLDEHYDESSKLAQREKDRDVDELEARERREDVHDVQERDEEHPAVLLRKELLQIRNVSELRLLQEEAHNDGDEVLRKD